MKTYWDQFIDEANGETWVWNLEGNYNDDKGRLLLKKFYMWLVAKEVIN